MDQGAACDRRHLVDGGHAVSAAAVRLSLRGGSRIEAVRNLQGDGTAIAEGDHQPGDDRDLVGRALPRLGRPLVLSGLAARQASAGGVAIGCPRFFFPLRQGFRRRPQSAQPEILSYYQRGTYGSHDRGGYPGSGKAVLTGTDANAVTAKAFLQKQASLRKADRFSILLKSHPTQADVVAFR